MGYIKHHAIIVTSWFAGDITQSRALAIDYGLTVSDVVRSPVNAYLSFIIVPDGSKEGWEESEVGNWAREKWIDTIKGSAIDWVLVRYGGDEPELAKIENHNNNP